AALLPEPALQPKFHPPHTIHPCAFLSQPVPLPPIPVFRLKNAFIFLIRLPYINAVDAIPPIAAPTEIYNQIFQAIKINIYLFCNFAVDGSTIPFGNKADRITGYHFEGIPRTVGFTLLGITSCTIAKKIQDGQYKIYEVGTFFHHLYYFS